MAQSKVTMITLSCPSLEDRQFEVSHAERLLAMPNNGGWHLPKDSQYEYKDGSITRRNSKKDNRA